MHSLGREEHDASGLHPFAGIVAGHKNGPFLQINDLHKIVPVGFHGKMNIFCGTGECFNGGVQDVAVLKQIFHWR